MNKQEIKELIRTGREIEFEYGGKKYSITYYGDGRPNYISFCEFYQEPIDVKNADELLNLKIGAIPLEVILCVLPEANITIY